ncbi:hypothetical protein [Larkinella harenae]
MYLQLFDTPAEGLGAAEGETNAGGIQRLRIMPANQLRILRPERFALPGRSGYPAFTLSSQHLFFQPDYTLTDVEIMPGSGEFAEPDNSSSQGVLYAPSIQLTIPKVRPDARIWLHQNRNVRWIAFLADRNGFFRCVGTPDQPLALSVNAGTGSGVLGRNQTVLTFSGNVQQPAYYLQGIDDECLIDLSPDFDESFSFEFNS